MRTYNTGKRCGHVWPETPGLCGGRILVQQTGTGDHRWEAYCDTCGLCDVDGHRTLREALKTKFFEQEERA